MPDLLLVFKRCVNPSWRTYEMLQHICSHMHGGIRKENGKRNPPPLHVTIVGKNLLIIDYTRKKRNTCRLRPKLQLPCHLALQPNDKVGYVQPIGERAIPGQVVNVNSTSGFGVGAFLLTASEMYRYVGNN